MNMYFLLKLSLIYIVCSCGIIKSDKSDNSDLKKNPESIALKSDDIEITLQFEKNNKKSLYQAINLAESELKIIEEQLNERLKRMNILTRIQYLRLSTLPNGGIKTVSSRGVTSNFDPSLFQTIDFIASFKRYSPALSDESSAHEDTLIHRKLVWPDLESKKVTLLKNQHNDLIFARVSQGLISWRIKTSYRELLREEFKAQAIHEYRHKSDAKILEKTMELLKNQKDCGGIADPLKKFVANNFADLGGIKDIKCSTDSISIEIPIFGKQKIDFLNISFSTMGKVFNEKLPDGAAFSEIIQFLLTARFDRLFN
jgi:hypothetical protein